MLTFLCIFLQILDEDKKTFLILNEIILTLKDVSDISFDLIVLCLWLFRYVHPISSQPMVLTGPLLMHRKHDFFVLNWGLKHVPCALMQRIVFHAYWLNN